MAAKFTEISNWLLEDIDPVAVAQDIPEEYANTFDFFSAGYYSNMYSDSYSVGTYGVYSAYSNYGNYSNSVSIAVQPVNQTINLGDSVSFSCTFSGATPTYQWYKANDSTETGVAISGATSATYSFTPTIQDDGKYFYCILTAGNVVNTSRALLSINSLVAYDIGVAVQCSIDLLKIVTPSTETVTSYIITDTGIASISEDGIVTGIATGSTTCQINSSNGLSKTFTIKVYDAKLDAVVFNIASAIRSYKNISGDITPSRMANILKDSSESANYSTLEEFFTDIANAIRSAKSITTTMIPEEMRKYILGIL